MSRQSKLLKHINIEGNGIEIGPSHNPVAPKSKGYNVHVIDHLDQEGLISKYRDHGVDVNKIENVDFIWRGESYKELTGRSKHYDWIIASHVIEHTPDLIGFIKSCDEVLKEDGIISLAIPDKRYCFDHYRPISSIAKIIDSHLAGATYHSPGSVAEYFLSVVSQSGRIAWNKDLQGSFSLVHSVEEAISGLNSVISNNTYFDIHTWCFVPSSFRLIIHDLFALGFTSFKELDFYQTNGHEFYMTLSKSCDGINKSRIALLQDIHLEVLEGSDQGIKEVSL